jgi:PAS domain S-box-containing protein
MNLDENKIENSIEINPSEIELEWNKKSILLCKTDALGTILYANESFLEVSGYDDFELNKNPHNIVRHPDMPQVIFKLLWENIGKGENFNGILKNKSKLGKYYWVVTDFKVIRDENENIISYLCRTKSVAPNLVDNFIKPLYRKLLLIEKSFGIFASEEYLIGFLEERERSFTEYTQEIIETGKDNFGKVKKKSIFTRLFLRGK